VQLRQAPKRALRNQLNPSSQKSRSKRRERILLKLLKKQKMSLKLRLQKNW